MAITAVPVDLAATTKISEVHGEIERRDAKSERVRVSNTILGADRAAAMKYPAVPSVSKILHVRYPSWRRCFDKQNYPLLQPRAKCASSLTAVAA